MNQHSDAADIVQVTTTLKQIDPLLAGKGSDIQGAVIADLLATWLAGHGIAGDERASQKLRAELLADLLQVVRQLTDLYARDLHQQTNH